CRTTDRSWAMNTYASPNSAWRRSSRLTTWAWIDTSSADTGSSQTMISGRRASARAMPMRWRWPPENWCGYRLMWSGSRPTPSTACTAPIRRLITTPRVSGKCLTRSRVRNTTSLIADDLLEEVAGAGPPGGHRTQRGQLGAAAVADVPAPGRERTARRDAGQVRRESLDHVEFGAL